MTTKRVVGLNNSQWSKCDKADYQPLDIEINIPTNYEDYEVDKLFSEE